MPDLDRIRAELGAFAAEVGCSLEPWQVGALGLEVRATAIVAPRQSGKSRSLGVLALWWAFRRPAQRVLIVSAGEEASRRLLSEVRRTVTGSPLLAGSVVDEQAQLLTLSNGSEVRSVPASERQVRGWTVDLLLIDEAALVPDDLLLGAAFPTTAARPDARIVMASSATVASGAFFDHVTLGEAGSEHVRAHRWALTDCGWIMPSAIEAARQSMTETRFRAEYEGVFASGADALFSREVLDRATFDYLPTPLAELRGPARVLAGVDWGATTDRSCLVAVARLPQDVYGVVTVRRWRAGEPLDNVITEVAASPAHFEAITMERNGLGEKCAQDLARLIGERRPEHGGGRPSGPVLIDAHEFEDRLLRRSTERRRRVERRPAPSGFRTHKRKLHVTAELKAATYSALRLMIDRGQLVLPASAEELLRELLMLRVDLSPSGTERIEASSGHDDLADALMLACTPYHRDKGWRSYLADLAEAVARRRASDELTVPRIPILQSVRTGEQTVPPGADVQAPEPPVRRFGRFVVHPQPRGA